jgi:hypothetical protein
MLNVGVLTAMPQCMVDQNQRQHRLCNRGRPDAHTRVMAPGRHYLGFFTAGIDCAAWNPDARSRL